MDHESWIKTPPDFSHLQTIQTVHGSCPNCGRPFRMIACPQLENPGELRLQFERIVENMLRRIKDLENQLHNQELCLRIAERLLKEKGLIL